MLLGLRSLSKIMLNSFWGKFGQRENLPTDEFVSDPARFAEIMFTETNVVHNVRVLSDKMLYVTYSKAEDHTIPATHSNVVVAAFTTANCRLRLYEELEKLDRRCFYFDTDSVIFLEEEGAYSPEIGQYLGQLTDELEAYGAGSFIDLFCSAGPKNYGFRVRKPDGKTVEINKVRGFTLNFHARRRLPLASKVKDVKDFVQRGITNSTTIVQPQITRNMDRTLTTKDVAKQYKVVYDKRRIMPDFSTLPFGFCL